jgi:hypothetical protein
MNSLNIRKSIQGNGNIELVFDFHHQIQELDRINGKLIDEISFGSYFYVRGAKLLKLLAQLLEDVIVIVRHE